MIRVDIAGTTYDVALDDTGYGTLTVENSEQEDAYAEEASFTAKILAITGGGGLRTETGNIATVVVADTLDATETRPVLRSRLR